MDQCERGLELQTILFDAQKFTEGEARDWLKAHDLNFGGVDITKTADGKPDTYRYRQREPGDFVEGSFRTVPWPPGDSVSGITGVLGCPKRGKEEAKRLDVPPDIQALAEKWIKRLRLGGIKIGVDYAKNLATPAGAPMYGEMQPFYEEPAAQIRIQHPETWPDGCDMPLCADSIERALVHELLHAAWMDAMAPGLSDRERVRAEERAVRATTEALLGSPPGEQAMLARAMVAMSRDRRGAKHQQVNVPAAPPANNGKRTMEEKDLIESGKALRCLMELSVAAKDEATRTFAEKALADLKSTLGENVQAALEAYDASLASDSKEPAAVPPPGNADAAEIAAPAMMETEKPQPEEAAKPMSEAEKDKEELVKYMAAAPVGAVREFARLAAKPDEPAKPQRTVKELLAANPHVPKAMHAILLQRTPEDAEQIIGGLPKPRQPAPGPLPIGETKIGESKAFAARPSSPRTLEQAAQETGTTTAGIRQMCAKSGITPEKWLAAYNQQRATN